MMRFERKLRFALPALVLCGLLAALAVSPAGAKGKDEYYRGQPEFDKGEFRGYFIWMNDEGWHIRWGTKVKEHNYSGTITCDGVFSKVKAVNTEKRDAVKQSGDTKITFDALAKDNSDGIDFDISPSTKSVTFDLSFDGKRTDAKSIRIGKGKRNPTSVPFTIDGLAFTPGGKKK